MSGAGAEGGHSVDCQDSPLAWRESLGKGQTSDALERLTQVVKIILLLLLLHPLLPGLVIVLENNPNKSSKTCVLHYTAPHTR